MSRNLTLLLAGLNLALAAALAWLWLSPSGQRNTHWAAPAALVPQLGAGSSGVLPGQESDAARLAAVLERPVFAVTRRPPPPAKVAAAAPVAPVAPPPDPLDGVHIYGMFSGSEGGGLIMRAEGKTRRLKVSESLGGWRLREIRGTSAVFVRAGETRVLPLVQVKPGPGASAGPPTRPPFAASSPPPVAASPATAPPSLPPGAAQVPGATSRAAPVAPGAARPPGPASSPFVIGGSR